MKTIRLIGCVTAILSMLSVNAQWWNTTGGNNISTTEWIGADNLSTIPLQIRNDADYPIDFYTTGRFRARINPVRSLSINGFSNIPTTGFMLISPDFTFLNVRKTPYSRLHLAEGVQSNASPWGYRDWQRNGITFTGNDDHGYIGHKYRGEDITDMVIQWSDNPGFDRADRMRFIFTSAFDGVSPTGMNSYEGLEGMRLWPVDDREINVGVGDFFADGTDPTERLHVLNGRVRIEELPNDDEALGLTKVMMVDDAAGGEYGVVKWLDVDNLIPTDCEWTMNTSAPNHVYTAVGVVDPNCPDDLEAVGIGVDPGTIIFPQVVAKLNVATTSTGSAFGTIVNVTGGGGGSVRGVQGLTYGTSNVEYAGDFQANGASNYASGVNAAVLNGTATGLSYGVAGAAMTNVAAVNAGIYGAQHVGFILPPLNGNYGVFGTTQNQVSGTDWAGYFRGDVTVTGIGVIPTGLWTTSDENLKENIEDIPSASEVIAQLNPKSYNFIEDALPQVGLPAGLQYGFLAQELEQVIPEAVKDMTFQAQMDSTGQEIYPAVASKIVNTDMLIPFLVAAFKEQQVIIQEQNDRLSQLEQIVSGCCTSNMNGAGDQINEVPEKTLLNDNGDRTLRIQPNPFTESTTIYYQLEQGGRMQLMANSADGKQLRVLHEANLEQGNYQFNWNTADLAPGIYYVTLLLDGKPLTKKAVKMM